MLAPLVPSLHCTANMPNLPIPVDAPLMWFLPHHIWQVALAKSASTPPYSAHILGQDQYPPPSAPAVPDMHPPNSAPTLLHLVGGLSYKSTSPQLSPILLHPAGVLSWDQLPHKVAPVSPDMADGLRTSGPPNGPWQGVEDQVLHHSTHSNHRWKSQPATHQPHPPACPLVSAQPGQEGACTHKGDTMGHLVLMTSATALLGSKGLLLPKGHSFKTRGCS